MTVHADFIKRVLLSAKRRSLVHTGASYALFSYVMRFLCQLFPFLSLIRTEIGDFADHARRKDAIAIRENSCVVFSNKYFANFQYYKILIRKNA